MTEGPVITSGDKPRSSQIKTGDTVIIGGVPHVMGTRVQPRRPKYRGMTWIP